MESNATDKPVPREIIALLSDERLILRETQRAVTPFGGIAVFISFLGKIGFVKTVREHMPIRWRSPNHIDPTSTFTAFLISVLVGARRFAHASLLRGDRALHALLGLERFPTDDTIRNLFGAFGMGQVQRLYEPLAEWQMQRLPQRAEGYTLDLDSTVFERYGQQEGSLKPRLARMVNVSAGRQRRPPTRLRSESSIALASVSRRSLAGCRSDAPQSAESWERSYEKTQARPCAGGPHSQRSYRRCQSG